jgi:hypothetical protein
MADGFRVDLGALEEASGGVNDTLGQLRRKKVSDIGGAKGDYGHDRLADTVSDFCQRWELGVEHLSKDAEEIGARLSQCVKAYLEVDKNLKGHLDGILQRPTGPDPAA